MNKSIEGTEVIVVGGGISGLAAASYLVRAGVGVTVFEKAPSVGGRAVTQKQDSFLFNRGIHALYCGGAAEAALKELGIHYSGRSPEKTSVLNQGKLVPLPVDPLSLLRTNLLKIADKMELLRLFATLPRLDAHGLRSISVQAWLEKHIHRPMVNKLFAALARTFVYTSALDFVSAEVFIKKFQLSLKNPVLYIDGGWQTLVDGLLEAVKQGGGRVSCGARVEAVERLGGQALGVRLGDGQLVRASAVLVAADPKAAQKLVDREGDAPLQEIVAPLVPAQIACLDVALRSLPNPAHPVVQDLDMARFLSAQSLYAQIAPPGGALIHTFKQLDPFRPTGPEVDERDLENLLDAAQPGWRQLLVKRVYLPRIEAVGALPAAASGGFAGRPDIRLPGLKGLYLAGDWIGPEGFLADACLASARQAAHGILQDLRSGSLSDPSRKLESAPVRLGGPG